ncbi:hypothetical protein BCR34DRAFT_603106 [Clohesyomyces aquaticus]|uniref:Nephrocystin 3-like N-terminal domain-containing protein n=1 Tax=Clohesyomyces aquaticus TaxID=1231657 RepID=A0A1Y1ZGZ9_9PLEO|nr:hypothetical protein BCR34DRAFT_603106 [Clohesyomyces aquaticus]
MDPLTAVGLAANVLQFVQFAGSLIATGNEIFHSAQGATADNLILDNIYGKLETLSEKLGNKGRMTTPTTEQERTIAALATQCKEDCSELLGVVRKLRVDGTKNRRWRSVKASLRTVWDGRRMDAMESRLERAQRILSLHIIGATRETISTMSETVNALKDQGDRLNINQSSNFDEIRQQLDHVRQEISIVQRASEHERDQHLPLSISPQDIDGLVERLRQVVIAERNIAKEQDVLANIDYEQRSARHEDIPESVENFEWIFNGEFAHWLEKENGMFWINGKAGSGKSTLMKFVAGNDKTYELLSKWAPGGFAVGSHYFWSPGSGMQKSLQGLIQSLLHDIFQKCPELMSLAFPQRWIQGIGGSAVVDQESWSEKGLCQALDNLAGQECLPIKLCFFIDGADELIADHIMLCEYLVRLTRSPNIKVCISSRPWVVFCDVFSEMQVQSLILHNISRGYISKHVRKRLESHPGWQILSAKEEDKEDFINSIIERAQGTFLWIFFVMRFLSTTLATDTLRNLRRRLDYLPSDLHDLFKVMIRSVDSIYYEDMARILLTAQHGDGPLSLHCTLS